MPKDTFLLFKITRKNFFISLGNLTGSLCLPNGKLKDQINLDFGKYNVQFGFNSTKRYINANQKIKGIQKENASKLSVSKFYKNSINSFQTFTLNFYQEGNKNYFID